jgi:hypothetical protein
MTLQYVCISKRVPPSYDAAVRLYLKKSPSVIYVYYCTAVLRKESPILMTLQYVNTAKRVPSPYDITVRLYCKNSPLVLTILQHACIARRVPRSVA